MAGHAQLKFVMTECSKTQIRLAGLRWLKDFLHNATWLKWWITFLVDRACRKWVSVNVDYWLNTYHHHRHHHHNYQHHHPLSSSSSIIIIIIIHYHHHPSSLSSSIIIIIIIVHYHHYSPLSSSSSSFIIIIIIIHYHHPSSLLSSSSIIIHQHHHHHRHISLSLPSSSSYSFLSIRMARQLALPTLDHGVTGSNPAGGEILPDFIAQSLSSSLFQWLKYCWRDIKP